MLEDIAIVTGGEVVTEDKGLSLENAMTKPGSAKPRKSSFARKTPPSSKGPAAPKSSRKGSAQIKKEIDLSDSSYDKEKLQERLAKLSGGVAVVKAGAATETELKEKKHRIEDALSATRAAVEEGIIAGGGSTLVQVIPTLEKFEKSLSGDEMVGVSIIRRSLEEPLKQIATNSGWEGSVVVDAVKKGRAGIWLRRSEL